MTFALAGNQNSGKTTLFNKLTGANQRVGNWPGVTVEKKEGTFAKSEKLVDLPGVYSLTPYSLEEKITREFILGSETDAIINIVDATNIERNLYLSLQLSELGKPMLIAVNMIDEFNKSGGRLDVKLLEQLIGIPVVPISARTGEGISELVRRAVELNSLPQTPKFSNSYSDYAELADARYAFIESVLAQCLFLVRAGESTKSNKLDDILTHRFWAIPIFIAILGLVFWVTFGPLGSFITDSFAKMVEYGIERAGALLDNTGASAWTRGLLVDGILTGVGAVLRFLPLILILFLCFSLLEDSGYMARAAYVLDYILKPTGLSGRSVIPMVMGFGCTVPAVMGCRSLQNERDRRLTIFITPFLSCGAKVPIYAMVTAAFFPRHGALVFGFVYLLGVAAAIGSAAVLGRLKHFKGKISPFILELPPYRIPEPRSVALLIAHKAGGFVKRAFTLILLGTVIIWLLSNFDFRLRTAAAQDSMLAAISGVIAYIFKPLGFGNWQATTAVLAGFTAKEAVVGTLAVIYEVGTDALPAHIPEHFTAAAALSFIVFNLLCMPCVAAVSCIRRELGSWKITFAALGYQTGLAWVLAFFVYHLIGWFV
ncbi:MAG: ferrous iron transport protein B [Oscillospiraceae bacterium]|nr:ferrous iron transport protein B [Oscillospiraceae bacterium]